MSDALALPVAPWREAGGRPLDDVRIANMVARRELIRFSRNRVRVLTALAQPLLFLFVLGTGLAPALPSGSGKIDFRTFIYPGVLVMTVLFPAIFSAMTIVWDRQEGFLAEMLVSPGHRWAVIVGKCAGGAAVAGIQGLVMLALGPLVHVPYRLGVVLVAAELALTAVLATALGLLVASRLGEIESFQVLIQLLVLPLFFLSGALFPLTRLPGWLAALTTLNPFTYAVDAMRRAIFATLHAPTATVHVLNPGVTWGSWRVPTSVELGIVAATAALMLAIAVARFSKVD